MNVIIRPRFGISSSETRNFIGIDGKPYFLGNCRRSAGQRKAAEGRFCSKANKASASKIGYGVLDAACGRGKSFNAVIRYAIMKSKQALSKTEIGGQYEKVDNLCGHDAFILAAGRARWPKVGEPPLKEDEPTPVTDYVPMVMVDGRLYLDSGQESQADLRCGTMDGKITSGSRQK